MKAKLSLSMDKKTIAIIVAGVVIVVVVALYFSGTLAEYLPWLS